MRRKEKTNITQIKNIYLIPALVIIAISTFIFNAFAIMAFDTGGFSGGGAIIEATQSMVNSIDDFVNWSNSIETPLELNPATIGNYANMGDELSNHLLSENYIDNIFSGGIPIQKELNDVGNYARSLQNINSIISKSLSTIDTQLNMSYRELSKVIDPNRSLVDPPTLLAYNDQLSAAKEKLQTLQELITTRLKDINSDISQLLVDLDTESKNSEEEGTNLSQLIESAHAIYDLTNTKPKSDMNQPININEISDGIEPQDTFDGFLSTTDAEIAPLHIFSKSVRADLEQIVVANIYTKLDYYQKILGQLTAFEPNKTVSKIRDTVLSRIDDLNARLDEIHAIDNHPFSFVYTGNEQDPRKIIDNVIELSNQFNNFENLTDQQKKDLETSAQFYQDALKLFILTKPEIQKLQTACNASDLPYDITSEKMSVSEWYAYTTLKNKLTEYYSKEASLQETILKCASITESISSGVRTALINPEQLDSTIRKVNNKLLSELLGVDIDVNNINNAEDLLTQLGNMSSAEFNKISEIMYDEIALLQILPPDFRIGYSSWSKYKSINKYLWSQLRKCNPKYLLDKLKSISKTSSSLSPIINKAIAILSARLETWQSIGQKVYDFEHYYSSDPPNEDYIFSIDSIYNGNQTLLGLAKEQSLELKTMLEQLQSSGTVNINELNKIKVLLTNYLTYLRKAEDIIPKSSYLKEDEVFKEAFEYLEKLYPDLSGVKTEINNLVTVVDKLLDTQSTLHTAATIQNNIGTIETQSTQLEERLKTASIVESSKIEKTLMRLYAQRNQLKNQLDSLTQKATDTLKIATIGSAFVNGNITFRDAQKRIADLQKQILQQPVVDLRDSASDGITNDVEILVQGETSSTTGTPSGQGGISGTQKLTAFQGYAPTIQIQGGDSTPPAPQDDTSVQGGITLTDSKKSKALALATAFDKVLRDDTQLRSIIADLYPDLYSGLTNSGTVENTLASVFSSPPVNPDNANNFKDEQTIVLTMLGRISLGENYSKNPVLSSAVNEATQQILHSYKNTRDILPGQFIAIMQRVSQSGDNFDIQQFSKETGISEDFISQIVELAKNNPQIFSQQINDDSISDPIGYVAIYGKEGFITFTANNKIHPYNIEKFQKLLDPNNNNKEIADLVKKEIADIVKSVNISEDVLRQIRDNISHRNNGVFVIITVDVDGKKVPVLVLSDTIVYINSTKPTEVAKEILKHILINRPNASEALVNRAFLLIVIIGLICIGFGIGLAVYITRLQLKKSNYFNPAFKHNKAYQHHFAPSWKTR